MVYLGEKRERRGNLFNILKEKKKKQTLKFHRQKETKGWMKEGSVDELWQARKYILFPLMKRGEKKRRRNNKIKNFEEWKRKKKKEKTNIEVSLAKRKKRMDKEGTMDELWQARNYIIIPLGEKRGEKKRRKNNKIKILKEENKIK